jgi:hypothetical protein
MIGNSMLYPEIAAVTVAAFLIIISLNLQKVWTGSIKKDIQTCYESVLINVYGEPCMYASLE